MDSSSLSLESMDHPTTGHCLNKRGASNDDEFEEDEIDWFAIPLHSISSSVTSHASAPALASNTVSNNGSPSGRRAPTTTEEGVEHYFRPSVSSGGIIDGVNSSSWLHRQQSGGMSSNGNQNQMGMGSVVANNNNNTDVETLRRQVKMELEFFWFPTLLFLKQLLLKRNISTLCLPPTFLT